MGIEQRQLDLLREQLAERSYPGYPSQTDRFFAGKLACDRLIIPGGPWQVDTHTNRRDNETTPSHDTQLELLAAGYRLDGLGRPLHPWLEPMAADPSLGVVTGKGAYWRWGPNKTADSAVIHGDRLLLIQRKDTRLWALPGGFVDQGDTSSEAAARREASEETGISIDVTGQQFYDGPVVDLRATAHAWPETTAFIFKLDESEPRPQPNGGDDAAVAIWVPLDNLPDRLFGAHRFLLDLAIKAINESSENE